MTYYLLPESGRFYKANLHTHTTISDGSYTPEQIKEHYKAHGYSVVAYTDHDVTLCFTWRLIYATDRRKQRTCSN